MIGDGVGPSKGRAFVQAREGMEMREVNEGAQNQMYTGTEQNQKATQSESSMAG